MVPSAPMSKSSELTVFRASGAITVPVILANAGPVAVKKFAEFFTVPIPATPIPAKLTTGPSISF
jgi:hypothetical protein